MPETFDYLPDGLDLEKVPDGKVLVHNEVYRGITPQHKIGMHGFRAWLTDKPVGRELKRCSCGWRPELGQHYRVR